MGYGGRPGVPPLQRGPKPDSVSGTGDRKGRPYGFMGTLSETWRAGEDARPCGLQRSRPFLIVGAGPRPACGRGTPQGGFSCPFGAIHLQPLPCGFQGHSFRVWVGVPLKVSRQNTHRERLLGKAKRSCETAPALIFCHARPQWVGLKEKSHSDFARRKCCKI